MASKDSSGYGRWRNPADGIITGVHRYAYELANGPIPEGLQVCHKCDNPKCVRHDHLFLGTNLDNVKDKMAKGRHKCGGMNVTHCKHGHEFTQESTRITSEGRRSCKICQRERDAVRWRLNHPLA